MSAPEIAALLDQHIQVRQQEGFIQLAIGEREVASFFGRASIERARAARRRILQGIAEVVAVATLKSTTSKGAPRHA